MKIKSCLLTVSLLMSTVAATANTCDAEQTTMEEAAEMIYIACDGDGGTIYSMGCSNARNAHGRARDAYLVCRELLVEGQSLD